MSDGDAAVVQSAVAQFSALAHIDRVVHEPARLLILSLLALLDEADFLFLLQQTGLTRGNLSTHARRLETAGYIEVSKHFVGRLPVTVYIITDVGREALDGYRGQMLAILAVPE